MTMAGKNDGGDPRIDYVELPSVTAHELTRAFYAKAFGWTFTDFGPDYAATEDQIVDVGLNGQVEESLSTPLPVIRVNDLDAAFDAVSKSGGVIAVIATWTECECCFAVTARRLCFTPRLTSTCR